MKKYFFAVVFVLIFVVNGVCLAKEYTSERQGSVFSVNTEQQTIFDGEQTYKYEISETETCREITVTYPDGAVFWQKSDGNSASSGWDNGYAPESHTDGYTLCSVIEELFPQKKNGKNPLLIILMLAIGAFYAAAPEKAWYLGFGWVYKNAEPSEAVLAANRIVGVAAAVAALILIFI